MKKAVILAGGEGTRLSLLSEKIPKSLVRIGDMPILEHQILFLKENGIKDIWLLLGYLGNQIKDYCKNGEKWDINIHYHQEKELLGTAGALKVLEGEIEEDFLVLSGDIMLDFDVEKFSDWHKQKKDSIVSIVVHPSDHPFDCDLVEIDEEKKIISLLKRPHSSEMIFHNLGISSVYIFSPQIFKHIPSVSADEKIDIEKDLLPQLLASEKKIYAYNSPEYIKDMGTPRRLEDVRKDYISGKIEKLSLKNKRRAVFLDRDGVINKEVDQLSNIEDLEVYDFTAKAIRKINEKGYLVIIVTNQPMIAKGFMTREDLDEIHKKIETEIGLKGAKIDAIYYCPHHPEIGFDGEVKELKIDCDCRKPKIGLLLEAEKEFNIDLEKSYLIGDGTVDILTGKKAGCKTILVKTGYRGEDGKFIVKSNFTAENLLEAAELIESFI